MHESFLKFTQNREIVDKENGQFNFSEVFHNLFPHDEKYSYSMKSYLKLLNNFEFDNSLVGEAQAVVNGWYQHFNINPHDNKGVFAFWVFLVEMFAKLIQNKPPGPDRPKFDNIFAFMNGFPIEKTRVVIIGLDPSPKFESSGYAFHKSDCTATHNLVKNFFNNDLKEIIKNGSVTMGEPEQPQALFNENISNLDGWIEQGVLPFNTYLTYGEPREELWLYFTKFLVKQLSSQCDSLVFILVCGVASRNFSGLIDKNKHEVIDVYHPTQPKHTQIDSSLKWETVLPFLRANEYLKQKKGEESMIDWKNVRN